MSNAIKSVALSWLNEYPGGLTLPICDYCDKELHRRELSSPEHELVGGLEHYACDPNVPGNRLHTEWFCPDHGVMLSLRKGWKKGHRQGPGPCGVCKLPVCLEWLETFHLIDRTTLQPTENAQGEL